MVNTHDPHHKIWSQEDTTRIGEQKVNSPTVHAEPEHTKLIANLELRKLARMRQGETNGDACAPAQVFDPRGSPHGKYQSHAARDKPARQD